VLAHDNFPCQRRDRRLDERHGSTDGRGPGTFPLPEDGVAGADLKVPWAEDRRIIAQEEASVTRRPLELLRLGNDVAVDSMGQGGQERRLKVRDEELHGRSSRAETVQLPGRGRSYLCTS
jgi:hypothetical protein